MIGKTIGKYHIVGQLGRGGMGTVYKAVDETLDREVAIKVLNPELADSEIMKRFRAEATTLAKLNHPEIATIYELFRSESDLLMVMEFVKGETLDRLSDRLGPLPPDRAAYLIDKVLSALEHAHRAGIVHRDMKPANVMVTEMGGVKIMDFGIARVRGAEHMTVDGYMMGTPAYMPPEQVLGQEVDGRADLYSVGVVFYRLLTGALPFKADTAIGMVQKQISDAPTPLNFHRQGLPDWCETVLHRALAKSPADRFQTAEEFRQALATATGMVTADHTNAFPAELDVATPPQPVKLETLGFTPPGLPAVPVKTAPSSASTTRATPLPAAGVSRPAKAAATATAATDGATIVLRTRHFAVAGTLLAILAVGVAVLAYVALVRPGSPSTSPVPTVSTGAPVETPGPTAAAQASASPAAPAPATVPPAPTGTPPSAPATPVNATTSPGGTPTAAQTQPAAPAPAQPTSAPTAAATLPGPARGHAPRVSSPAASAGPGARVTTAAKPGAAVRTKAFLPLALDARALVTAGNQQREREAKVHLADGKVTITPDDNPNEVIHAMPYEGIVSINYSRGRDPLWHSPEGPALVLRAGAGALGGMFRGTRHWVTLRTRDARDLFIVLRFANDVQVKRALTALEERTGKAAELVAERKDVK